MIKPVTIGIFSDTHGNLAALTAIYDLFRLHRCDEIIHTGDMVCIGPQSAECLAFMFSHKITLINGNHDINYVNDDTVPPPKSHVPARHKRFVFDELGGGFRERVRYLPLIVRREIYGKKFAFLHYGLAKNDIYKKHIFEPINPFPTAEFFDDIFDGIDADAVFFGHKHEPVEFTGKRLYVDVGSVGCHEHSFARGIILRVHQSGRFEFERVRVPYDRMSVKRKMLEKNIPFGEELFDFYFRENLNNDKLLTEDK